MSDEPPVIPAKSHGIAVSLSGGGVRATFFSLGSLQFLVDSGLNRDVRVITSVSGGSIANVIATLRGDFARVSSTEFKSLVQTAVNHISERGVFYLATGRSVRLFLLGFSASGALLAALGLAVLGIPPSAPSFWIAFACTVVLAWVLSGVVAVALVFSFRRLTQPQEYAQLIHVLCCDLEGYPSIKTTERFYYRYRRVLDRIGRVPILGLSGSVDMLDVVIKKPEIEGPGWRKVQRYLDGRWKHLGAQVKDQQACDHVLCATDLASGGPVYLGTTGFSSPNYVGGLPEACRVLEMLYASAAFPGVFSPLRSRASAFGFDAPSPAQDDALALCDGGVYNNLGTEALTTVSNIRSLIVVNSGAPSRRIKPSNIPVLRQILDLIRTNSVTYGSTVSARLRTFSLANATLPAMVIDIATTPSQLLSRISKEATDSSIRDRSEELVAAMSRVGSGVPPTFLNQETLGLEMGSKREDLAAVPTTLWPIGNKLARSLVDSGYYSTAVAAYCLYGPTNGESADEFVQEYLSPSPES